MARLPIPGGDNNTWGDVLNEFLRVRLNEDGTLKTSAAGDLKGATLLVAANDASAAAKRWADYTCDGTADDVQINAALTALPTGGGKVVLSEGWFTLAAPIVLTRNNTSLVGQGRGATSGGADGATVLFPVAGMNASVITLANGDVTGCHISDLMIDGNRDNQASGHGIFLDNTACSEDAPRHVMKNLFIKFVKQDGVHLIAPKDGGVYEIGGHAQMIACDLMWNNGVGVYAGSNDFKMLFCDVGKSGLENIVVGGGNPGFFACSIWAAGQIDPSHGDGMYLASGHAQVIGCVFQDNVKNGIAVGSSAMGNDSIISGCTFDSNGLYHFGIDLWNGNRITISGCVFIDRHAGTGPDPHLQYAGIKADGDSTTDVLVTGCHFSGNANCPVLFGGYLLTGAVEFKNNNYSGDAGVDGLILDPGASGAIAVNMSGHVPLVTAGAETRTLAAPARAGLDLVLYAKTLVGNCVVTCATTINEAGNTTMTFSATGQAVRLYSVEEGSNLRWRCAQADGVALG